MSEISRPVALQRFFTVPGKAVTAKELLELKNADPVGFDKIADACLELLSPNQNKQ